MAEDILDLESDYDEITGDIETPTKSTSDGTQFLALNDSASLSQWGVMGGGVFRATSSTKQRLPAGVYSPAFDMSNNLIFVRQNLVTDELVELPGSEGTEVLTAIRKFWTRKDKFDAKRQVFKRGVLLHGPPGGGKTSVIMLLVGDLVKADGIVIYVNNPTVATLAITQLRKVEPDRPVICILEDLDELVRKYGEHDILSLLDGETQVANIVFVATTNYPEHLAKRIINRPSRFDLVVKVNLPSAEARRHYLSARMPELSATELDMWVADSKDFSIAHLRELMVCTSCLSDDYSETLSRLKNMDKFLSSDSESRKIGLR